jgi:hypothetical protein
MLAITSSESTSRLKGYDALGRVPPRSLGPMRPGSRYDRARSTSLWACTCTPTSRTPDGCRRDALDLLESKLLPGEGWAMEPPLFNHSEGKDGFTQAPWEELTLGRPNLLRTIDALDILRTAGRW